MTEKNKNSLSTIEIIRPSNTPEAAFQSYEQLTSNSNELKQLFLSGGIRNPHFDYPHFYNLSEMDRGIITLQQAIDAIRRNESDEFVVSSCESSLRFRQAEMEYVKLLGQLHYVIDADRPIEDVRELAESARQLNKELYGEPDSETVDAALNELWTIIDTKNLSGSALIIKHELENGFVHDGLPIDRLRRPLDSGLRLPQFANNPALEWAGEYVIEKNADIMAAIDEFWGSKLSEHGDNYVCGPDDIVEAFQLILDLRDPLHESGVSIKKVDGKTALSWETPEMAVHVGSNRRPIKSAKELFDKIMHEFGVHGQRAINGLKHQIPVMGLGVFTDTARPDYLTFEEGLAKTIEEMSGDVVPTWDADKLGLYINIAEAADGNDFRSVFEKTWRYKLLAEISDSEEVTEEMIERVKSKAYTTCVRIFRGQPNDIVDRYPGIKPLTFNKDLAYINGQVIAMRYLEEVYRTNDTESLDFLFEGKFDPTIPEQLAIASYQRAA